MAYLVMMAARLVELHRVLKPTEATTHTTRLSSTSTTRAARTMRTFCTAVRAWNHPHDLLTNSGVHPSLFTQLRRVMNTP